MTGTEWALTAIVIAGAAILGLAGPRIYRDLRDVWRSRQPLPPWTPPARDAVPVPSPAHDAILLFDAEKDIFDGLVGQLRPEDAS